ncbi:TPA: hypothetical protein NGR52_004249 [Vibrio parahaemolyticus]|nr:hypothetical protein [Vibrio parahaemolyticus]
MSVKRVELEPNRYMASSCVFEYEILEDINGVSVLKMVCCCNDVGGMSLTNAMGAALAYVLEEEDELPEAIIYLDSEYEWSQVICDPEDIDNGLTFQALDHQARHDETLAVAAVIRQAIHE